MRVVQAPPIQFKCGSCGAINQGEAEEFVSQNTRPPTWAASCAYCRAVTHCSPLPLIARFVGAMSSNEVLGEIGERLAAMKR